MESVSRPGSGPWLWLSPRRQKSGQCWQVFASAYSEGIADGWTLQRPGSRDCSHPDGRCACGGQKVIQAMGLAQVKWSGIWTPYYPTTTTATTIATTIPTISTTTTTSHSYDRMNYPTKKIPHEFFSGILSLPSLFSFDKNSIISSSGSTYSKTIILIDDSSVAIKALEEINNNNESIFNNDNIHGIQVIYKDGISVQRAIGMAMKWEEQQQPQEEEEQKPEEYKFDEIQYLINKNKVDLRSMNRQTWNHLIQEIIEQQQYRNSRNNKKAISNNNKIFQIVDVGAGVLSMLRLIINGYNTTTTTNHKYNNNNDNNDNNDTTLNVDDDDMSMPSLLSVLQQQQQQKYHPSNNNNSGDECCLEEIHYYAYELNKALRSACINELKTLGFVVLQKPLNDDNNNNNKDSGSSEFSSSLECVNTIDSDRNQGQENWEHTTASNTK